MNEKPHLVTLADHIEMESEGTLSPAQSAEAEEIAALEAMFEESGIRKVERLLDGEMTRRVLTLTPDKWREMDAHEQLNMQRWLENRIKAFSERLCFIRRNCAPEPEVPGFLKQAG